MVSELCLMVSKFIKMKMEPINLVCTDINLLHMHKHVCIRTAYTRFGHWFIWWSDQIIIFLMATTFFLCYYMLCWFSNIITLMEYCISHSLLIQLHTLRWFRIDCVNGHSQAASTDEITWKQGLLWWRNAPEDLTISR